jgi:hypothetical protein
VALVVKTAEFPISLNRERLHRQPEIPLLLFGLFLIVLVLRVLRVIRVSLAALAGGGGGHDIMNQ